MKAVAKLRAGAGPQHGSWTVNGTVYRRSQDTLLTPDEAEVEYLWPYSLGADGVVIWSGQGEKNALDDDPAANASL